jgi:hypothetical protein
LGVVVVGAALLAVSQVKETFGTDLNYVDT